MFYKKVLKQLDGYILIRFLVNILKMFKIVEDIKKIKETEPNPVNI